MPKTTQAKQSPQDVGDYFKSGVLGETTCGTPRPELAKGAFELKDDSTHFIGFDVTETSDGGNRIGAVRLSKLNLGEIGIFSEYLESGKYTIGTVQAMMMGIQAYISGANVPYDGLIGKQYHLEPGSLDVTQGSYHFCLDLSLSGEFPKLGELEHQDDFEHAFNISYKALEYYINRSQRIYTFKSNSATTTFDPGSFDAQLTSNKRVLVQDLIDDLRHQQPELLPSDIGTITGLSELIEALEQHWRRCFSTLKDLSKLRDYNKSHSAISTLRVDEQARPPRMPSMREESSATNWAVSPLHNKKASSSATNWTVNPLQSRQVATGYQPGAPGKITLLVKPKSRLLGNTKELISFKNRYFKEGYSNSHIGLSSETEGVSTYVW